MPANSKPALLRIAAAVAAVIAISVAAVSLSPEIIPDRNASTPHSSRTHSVGEGSNTNQAQTLSPDAAAPTRGQVAALQQLRERLAASPPTSSGTENNFHIADGTNLDEGAYSFVPRDDGSYVGRNPTQGFYTYFSKDRDVKILHGAVDGGLSVKTVAIGAGRRPKHRISSRSGVPASVKRSRIEFDLESGLKEWYANGPDGLEQGWTVESPLPGAERSRDFRIEIALDAGEMDSRFLRGKARREDEGIGVAFHDAEGREAWRYDKLKVTDANGHEVPSHMELVSNEPGRPVHVDLVVAAHDFAYPLTIDPLISSDLGSFYQESSSSDPTDLTVVGDTLYFVAHDGVFLQGLWATDGTVAGTRQITTAAPLYLTPVGSELFFVADDSGYGYELWATDGTKAGTRLVRDINPGSGGSNPEQLTESGGLLYFVLSTSQYGQELWKSDGTEVGTVMVKDINPNGGWSSPSGLLDVGGVLYFTAHDELGNGRNLWRSDGTEMGTTRVKEFAGAEFSDTDLVELTAVGSELFFVFEEDFEIPELWKSDGTEMGTVLVKAVGGEFSPPENLTAVGTKLFFSGYDATNGRELWVSDGTEMGTELVKDISPSSSSFPGVLTPFGGEVYFFADGGVNGEGLWKSNGTMGGTTFVKEILGTSMFVAGGNLYFDGDDPTNGRELWVSDGSPGGTNELKDIFTDLDDSDPGEWAEFDGDLYFAAKDPVNGRELWRSDGTGPGTELVRDIRSSDFLNAGFAIEFGGKFYFSAYEPNTGYELWVSDGTLAGTEIVKDIEPDELSSFPYGFVEAGGKLFFIADTLAHGAELWTTDGTEMGTQLVKEIGSGGSDGISTYYATPMAEIGGLLFFAANDGSSGLELWTSDGTEMGTDLFLDIAPGYDFSQPGLFTEVNGTFFFAADDGTGDHGRELWATDGTTGNTRMVKDIDTGSVGSQPEDLIQVGNLLFFTADDGTNGRELFATDGTEMGTLSVGNLGPGSYDGEPDGFFVFGNELFFNVLDSNYTRSLWKSDGTPGGTTFVMEDEASFMAELNGQLFFQANNQLWTSDGTSGGTSMLVNVKPEHLINVNGRLLFTVTTNGETALWTSDGTAMGTQPIDGVQPWVFSTLGTTVSPGLGIKGSTYVFIPMSGGVFFRGYTEENGFELWFSDGSAAGTAIAEDGNPGPVSSYPHNFAYFGNSLLYTIADPLGGRSLRLFHSVPPVIVNEIDSVSTPSGTREFIELFDGGSGNTDLSDLTLVLFDGSTDTSYRTVDLSGKSTDGNGYFVIGASGTPNVDFLILDGALNDGPAAVGLYQDSAASFPNGTAVTVNNLIDSVVYDNGSADDSGLLVLVNENEPQLNEDEFSTAASNSLQRIPNGSGGRFNTSTYVHLPPTPGGANTPPTPPAPPVLLSSSDTGISNSDRITMDTSPTIRVSTSPGAQVVLTSDIDGIVGTLSANGSGDADITTTTLSEGTHQLTATANGSSPSSALSIEIDITPPSPPGVPDLLSASDSGSSNTDNVTNVTAPGFSGSAPAGVSLVTLYEGTNPLGTDGPNPGTSWSITSASLTHGAYSVTAKTSDVAGNESAAGPALGIQIDTSGPTVTIDQKSGEPDPASGDPLAFTAVFSEPVTGFSPGDVSVSGSLGGSAASVSEDSPGTFTVLVTPNSGEGTVFASIPGGGASDIAGNASLASTSGDNRYTVDLFEPSSGTPSPILLTGGMGSQAGFLTSGDEDAFTFTLPLDASVVVYTTGSTDTRGELLNSLDVVVNNPGADDDAGTDSNFRSSVDLTAGTYTVKVTVNTGEGEYELHVEANLPNLQPDLYIGSIGRDVYGGSGGQTQNLRSKRARTVRTTITLQNDGDATDGFTVRSTSGNRLFKVSCSSPDGNVSAALFSGSLEVFGLAPDVETYPISVTIKPNKRKLVKIKRTKRGKKTIYLKKRFTQKVTATSSSLGTQSDSVAIQVKTK